MMIIVIFFFILGLIWGSFLNCLIYRLVYNLPITKRSFCPLCKKKLLNRDLIPVFSYFLLGGKCRFCGQNFGWHYLAAELLTGLVFVSFFLKYWAFNFLLVRDLIFASILILIFFIDLKYYLILDRIIWVAIFLAIALNLIAGPSLSDLILGIIIGVSFFLFQYLVSKAKWIGLGDVKLGALLGAMLGWQFTVLTIVLAYLIGGITALLLLLSKQKKISDVLPLGSFLAAAGIIVLLVGDKILTFFFI